jgi:hypothetical protein
MQDKRRQGLGIVGIKIEKADMDRINEVKKRWCI